MPLLSDIAPFLFVLVLSPFLYSLYSMNDLVAFHLLILFTYTGRHSHRDTDPISIATVCAVVSVVDVNCHLSWELVAVGF